MTTERPQGKGYKPPFKAIETKYDNYRFRSRLEARHALFFNTLGIPYIYKMEGFDLEGTWYLPDFYLPQHNCFIEIKGVEPTQEELNKAYLLSYYTLKDVYIFSGEVGIDKYGESAYAFYPPSLEYFDANHQPQKYTNHPEVVWVLEKLAGAAVQIDLNENQSDFTLTQNFVWNTQKMNKDWDFIYHMIESFSQETIQAVNLLRTHHNEVTTFLKMAAGGWEALCGMGSNNNCWVECSQCSKLAISQPNHLNAILCCRSCGREIDSNAPRILDAYRVAREHRF